MIRVGIWQSAVCGRRAATRSVMSFRFSSDIHFVFFSTVMLVISAPKYCNPVRSTWCIHSQLPQGQSINVLTLSSTNTLASISRRFLVASSDDPSPDGPNCFGGFMELRTSAVTQPGIWLYLCCTASSQASCRSLLHSFAKRILLENVSGCS